MRLNKKEEQKRIAIVKALSDLSRDGWAGATEVDWKVLEAELAKLEKSPRVTKEMREAFDPRLGMGRKGK